MCYNVIKHDANGDQMSSNRKSLLDSMPQKLQVDNATTPPVSSHKSSKNRSGTQSSPSNSLNLTSPSNIKVLLNLLKNHPKISSLPPKTYQLHNKDGVLGWMDKDIFKPLQDNIEYRLIVPFKSDENDNSKTEILVSSLGAHGLAALEAQDIDQLKSIQQNVHKEEQLKAATDLIQKIYSTSRKVHFAGNIKRISDEYFIDDNSGLFNKDLTLEIAQENKLENPKKEYIMGSFHSLNDAGIQLFDPKIKLTYNFFCLKEDESKISEYRAEFQENILKSSQSRRRSIVEISADSLNLLGNTTTGVQLASPISASSLGFFSESKTETPSQNEPTITARKLD